jgi:hypothetical protein
MSAKRDYTRHQQKIIKRYYDNLGTIKSQRLAELAGELYLATGKKTADAMTALGVPKSRIEHILKQRNPAILAELVKELEAKK